MGKHSKPNRFFSRGKQSDGLAPLAPPAVSSDAPDRKAREFDEYAEKLNKHNEQEIEKDPSFVGRETSRIFGRRR